MALQVSPGPLPNQLAGLAVAATAILALPSAVLAACEEIARIPLVSGEAMSAEDGAKGFVCVWQTEDPWTPPEACGNQGFEVVGWGDRPPVVVFKRRNTVYSRTWETQDVEKGGAGSPIWTSASIEMEDLGNRCFAGWCTPVNYVLRTAEPASKDLCGQAVELRIRMSDRTE